LSVWRSVGIYIPHPSGNSSRHRQVSRIIAGLQDPMLELEVGVSLDLDYGDRLKPSPFIWGWK